MQLQIKNEKVRKNIELFLHILHRIESMEKKEHPHQRVYKAYLNRFNGDLLFVDLLPDPSLLDEKDWKVVLLRCESNKEELSFEIIEPTQQSVEKISELAHQTISETIHMLNVCAKSVEHRESFEQQMEDLGSLSIGPSLLKGSYDLIEATWHPIDRVQAENLLFQRPYGSFLFRKDFYAEILEEMLEKIHGPEIRCFTLTFVEPVKKITDLTVVFKGDCCLFYNDDPSLLGATHPNLRNLLLPLFTCKYPVFH